LLKPRKESVTWRSWKFGNRHLRHEFEQPPNIIFRLRIHMAWCLASRNLGKSGLLRSEANGMALKQCDAEAEHSIEIAKERANGFLK
jgi:hypothetical protein